MEKIIIIMLLSVGLFSCTGVDREMTEQHVSVSTEQIDSIMDNWHLAAGEANFADYFDVLDSISVFIGTDASENWTKEQFSAFSKPYFDQGKAWSFKARERNVYFSQDSTVAWFDELLDTWMGTCRGSGVLEIEKDAWKLKHYVLSVSIPNDAIQSVIAVKSSMDSLFRVNFEQTKDSFR